MTQIIELSEHTSFYVLTRDKLLKQTEITTAPVKKSAIIYNSSKIMSISESTYH